MKEQEQEQERRHDQPGRRNRKEQKEENVKLRRAVALNSGMFSMKRRGVYPFRDAMLVQCRLPKFANSHNARETN